MFSFPNHITTAQAVLHSIQYPVHKHNLLQIIDQIKHGALKRRDRESMTWIKNTYYKYIILHIN